MPSLFKSVVSYIPRANRNPQEDFLTKIFAWLLTEKNIPGLGNRFCIYLIQRLENPRFCVSSIDIPAVTTQVAVPGGFIDMVLEISGNGFICEHKISSPFGENQVERYAQAYSLRLGKFYTVIITGSPSQHSQDADIKLIWADVQEFLTEQLYSYQNEHAFMLRQVIEFIKDIGLGKSTKITMQAAQSIIQDSIESEELLCSFTRINENLATMKWVIDCPGIQSINPTFYSPTPDDRPHEGRIGVNFFREWTPGLIAGIIYDNNDSKLDMFNDIYSPYLLVSLTFSTRTRCIRGEDKEKRRKIVEQWRHYRANDNLLQLRLLLADNSDGFLFDRSPNNETRVIPLYKPLRPIIESARSEQEQIEMIYSSCCRAVHLLTQCDLLAGIRRYIDSSYPELQL